MEKSEMPSSSPPPGYPGAAPQYEQYQPPPYESIPPAGEQPNPAGYPNIQQNQPPPQQNVVIMAAGQPNRWYQPICGCFDNLMICLATFCCQECVFFCIAYYGRLMKYFIWSYICLGVATFMYFIYQMIVYSNYDTSASSTSYPPEYHEYPPLAHFFLTICSLIITGAAVIRIILFAVMRLRLREKYNIRGAFCEDCLYSWFCTPCATCQMMAEVDHQLELQGERTIFTRV